MKKGFTIREMPRVERPREKLIAKGPENLKDEELLAILLRTGIKGKNVLEIAKQILRKYSKKRILRMTYEDLIKIKGIDSAKACTILAAVELVKRALKIGEETLPTIKSISDVIAQMSYLRDKTREHLAALYLNARNEMVHKKHLFVGTLNANLVHPREIFDHALRSNAASLILVHNHPSSDPEPSQDDLEITKRIIQAGKIMGIDILDHIIITKTKALSFKQKKINMIMEEPFYKKPEEEMIEKPKLGKGTRETDTRILVDRLLREAGWDIEDKNQVSTGEPTKSGRFVDYLLKDRRGRGLAIVETKRFSIDPVSAKQQALEYADDLKVDFIFLSNGEDIYFWDFKNRTEQKVVTFFSQKDLEKIKILRQERKPLSIISVPDKYFKGGEEKTLRPYQKEAMEVMDRTSESGKRKMLIAMATGTGKTDVIALQMRRMFQAGLISRVLFLVDRIELGKQAQDAFNDILKDYPSILLFGGRRKKEAQIVISTLQTIYSQLEDFTSGYFDLVVSDEAHRSVYNVYNAVLSHFDAIRIGLTATPSAFIDRNTYKLFDCWDEKRQDGIPTFKYGIRRGIEEGYLAGYDIVQIDTKVSLEGIRYEGEDYHPEDLEKRINVPARNEQIAKALKEEEEKREPKRPKKTIIYAITQNHAAQLAYYLNQAYPEYNGRYAETITSNVADAGRAITRFKKEELPYVAVSVGMLDTGFDAPAVESIAMVRPTRSPILYQQMRGRGSRLCPKINKTSFRIYDFVGVTRDFNDESFNPYSKYAPARRGIPWGTEIEELPPPKREVVKRLFVQVPATAPENVDLIVKRAYVEIGPQGEKIDVADYQYRWETEIKRLVETDPLIKKVKAKKELTNEELKELTQKLNSPEFYFNETNLRGAYHYPQGALPEFIKAALDIYKLPTEEQQKEDKINDLFEAWLINKNFDAEQVKILRMVKNHCFKSKEKADISIFNESPFAQLGGLPNVIKLFGEKQLPILVRDMNKNILQYNYGSKSSKT